MIGVAKRGRSAVMLDLDGIGLQRSVSSRNSMTRHQTCGAWDAASTSLCRLPMKTSITRKEYYSREIRATHCPHTIKTGTKAKSESPVVKIK